MSTLIEYNYQVAVDTLNHFVLQLHKYNVAEISPEVNPHPPYNAIIRITIIDDNVGIFPKRLTKIVNGQNTMESIEVIVMPNRYYPKAH
jgi:hypothetical protein